MTVHRRMSVDPYLSPCKKFNTKLINIKKNSQHKARYIESVRRETGKSVKLTGRENVFLNRTTAWAQAQRTK